MDLIHLDILTSPNCPYSPKALRVAQRVISRHKEVPILLREVSVATHEGEEMAEAFEIDSTPTFAINGRIAFVGVPAPEVLSNIIHEELEREKSRNSYFF
ncbi:MAG: thioredoxin family protein [Candidatus Micrarchaeota archaeon]